MKDFRNTQYAPGIRRNNPGNIRSTPTQWQGKDTANTSPFEQFITIEHGLRALMINAHTLATRDGYNTIAKLITKWAPPHENNTQAYINHVCKALQTSPNEPIAFTMSFYIALAKAIAQMECGKDYLLIPESSYTEAYAMLPISKKADAIKKSNHQ